MGARSIRILLFAALLTLGAGNERGLSDYAPHEPSWMHLPAESEQHPPLYFGGTPFELRSGKTSTALLQLPQTLRASTEKWLHRFAKAKGLRSFDVEFWPTRIDGEVALVLARYRPEGSRWRWVESSESSSRLVFAEILDIGSPASRKRIFSDFLELPGLYDKPLFGDCVWLDERGTVVSAWQPPHLRTRFEIEGLSYCAVLPQPPRFRGIPRSFEIRVADTVHWPTLQWVQRTPSLKNAKKKESALVFPSDFLQRYEADLRFLTGPDFPKKSSAEEKNSLEALVDYLEERYHSLGLETQRQRFRWRGIAQSNLIAIIPGAKRELPPVLLADHFDTAFAEDLFIQYRKRVSVPGADDNATATAALLRAAEILRPAERDIWLVHLTGEEYPGDCLGARHFVRELLREKKSIAGVILLDMIGYRAAGDPVFQINPGEGKGARLLAERLLQNAARAPELRPHVHFLDDPRSYLYNTDGIIFSDAGYPVVLLNEHLNRFEGIDRSHYHESTDTLVHVDLSYAATLSQLAIETAQDLASERRAP